MPGGTRHHRLSDAIDPCPVVLLFSACVATSQPAPSLRPDLPPGATNSIHFKRWLWHEQERTPPAGLAPHEARARALQQLQAAKAQPAISAAATVPGNAWIPIGPAPIFNGQTSGSQPVSGRIGDISVNPSNLNHWVIGTAQGGLWQTFNSGGSWKAMTDLFTEVF